MPTLAADELDRLALPPTGAARAVFVGDGPGVVLAALEERATAENFRVVSIRYDRLPRLTSLIDDVLGRLAELALATWPDWPDDDGAASAWRKSAAALCERGRPPLPRGWTASDSARRLARAIDAAPLAVALAADDAAPPSGALLGLARAAEWLAREAPARVLVVAPDSLAGSAELDAVAFDATYVRTAAPAKAEEPPAPRPGARISPLIGRPNPMSGGEKLLAERLGRDADLAGLFRYNVRVETARRTRPLVDLVWEEGKVVVEVDGYYFHRDERAFSGDRNRDYELTISGYLVLRLPEDEVVADVGLAVEKIRDVVAVRRAAPPR
ncbi:DUF559 domain-containing protein [Paludisphaera sp.]|uniref:endonuclease domain-containing protein n=1 Tax=Paludisphaera sp. TaxID=2017432 RepID=UPI00301E04D4